MKMMVTLTLLLAVMLAGVHSQPRSLGPGGAGPGGFGGPGGVVGDDPAVGDLRALDAYEPFRTGDDDAFDPFFEDYSGSGGFPSRGFPSGGFRGGRGLPSRFDGPAYGDDGYGYGGDFGRGGFDGPRSDGYDAPGAFPRYGGMGRGYGPVGYGYPAGPGGYDYGAGSYGPYGPYDGARGFGDGRF